MIDIGLETGITKPEYADVHRQLYRESLCYRKGYGQLMFLMKLMFFGYPATTILFVWVWWWGKTSISLWWIDLGVAQGVVWWLFWFIWQPLKRRRRGSASHLKTQLVQDSKLPTHPLEFCLRIFLSSKDCDNILGDLEDRFVLDCERFGRRRAHILRACDLTRSLWPFLTGAARKLIRWGVFASAAEWVRRFI